MVKFACLPNLSVVKKKSKTFSRYEDAKKKGSGKSDLRVKPIDHPENDLKAEHVSKSFPSVEEEQSSLTSLPLSDDSSAQAAPTEAAEIRSMKTDHTVLDPQPKLEPASHGPASEKTETDQGIAAEKMIASEAGQKVEDELKKLTVTDERSSNVDRVSAWINGLDDCSFMAANVEDGSEEREDEQSDQSGWEIVESSNKSFSNPNRRAAEEVAQASNVVQSLNTLSTVADITGIGLKFIPSISAFACLRSVNLSGNCIVNITPGSLPKSLHTLDLSRNKISAIEGLQGLERLRVLNLSCNRIAKISHGLSSCTLIKELYLGGNKISNVEGLHRLLKLTVLDLSFNRIITVKGLGQLVANYSSLLALNLLGNPILANVGEDQLRKAVLNLVPHVTYLNKQPVKPHRVREVVSERVTKAALGDAAGSSKRKLTKRLSHGSGSLPKGKVAEAIKHGKGRHSAQGQ